MLSDYCAYVSNCLITVHAKDITTWQQAAMRHRIPIPYAKALPSISTAIQRALPLRFTWAIMLQQRPHVQLRCGLIDLGHVAGRATRARNQCCLWCDSLVAHVWVHIFGECHHWADHRRRALAACRSYPARSWEIVSLILLRAPDDIGYVECLSFIYDVVVSANSFWSKTCASVDIPLP